MFGRVCLLCSLSRPVVSAHLSRTHQLRALYSSYESQYSLNKLYPGSDQDVTKPLDKPSKELFLRLQDDIEEVSETEKFSGFIPIDKLNVKFSKSGGPGGQNVNKVESKVDLRFHLESAEWLPASIRAQIQEKKQTNINAKGELVITSQKTRSQMRNVQDCLQKLRDIIAEVQRTPKEPDENSAAVWRMRQEKSTRERLKQKTIHSRTKTDRQVYADE
ncbi:large ribosomal subunit protein mL62-like [Apostichopus japonicus]|uniref:large ribosomal subunit protein mL62-like n=1 Tax=Stichopus japonicus TaxID=307972 RepID=UPI003AB4F9FD